MAQAWWTVERTRSRRFPVRIAIEQGGRLLLALRAQSAWPGPGQQIFCLRERELDPAELLEPVERVPIANLTRIGRKLALVLDRPTRKRCELLTVAKPYKDGDGSYEQVFFRTESGIRAHRSRTRIELKAVAAVHIAIDSGERYPGRFPGATVERRQLRAGDYALLENGRETALVERKSFDNFLGDIGAIQALHGVFADLASQERTAVVIEAQYGDLLDERRVKGRWPVAHLERALGRVPWESRVCGRRISLPQGARSAAAEVDGRNGSDRARPKGGSFKPAHPRRNASLATALPDPVELPHKRHEHRRAIPNRPESAVFRPPR